MREADVYHGGDLAQAKQGDVLLQAGEQARVDGELVHAWLESNRKAVDANEFFSAGIELGTIVKVGRDPKRRRWVLRQPASTAMLGGTLPARPERAFDLVRVTRKVNGMPAGSEGIVVRGIAASRYAYKADDVLVRFWDGGPLRVPGNALARIGRLPAGAVA